MGVESSLPVAVGEVFAGKYRVERVLGVGGMGGVVQAMHLDLDQRVAIKFMLSDVSMSRAGVERFLREAKAVVRLQSEHVARVLDVGRLETGEPYLVMEFLHGQDISQLVRERGPLPVAMAVDAVLQSCAALAEAHALGIVHRDIKPANLFLTSRTDGSAFVKVLDFGISKSAVDGGLGVSDLTGTADVIGSPRYMSPEQMKSAKLADARADIWALGTVLFEMLTARPAFDGDSLPALCMSISSGPSPSVRVVRGDVHESLDRIVSWCLEKDPARRPQNVGELASSLRGFASPACAPLVDRIINVLLHVGSDAMSHGPTIPAGDIVRTDSSVAAPAGTGPSATDGSWGLTAAPPTAAWKRPTAIALSALAAIVLIAAGTLTYAKLRARTPATPADALIDGERNDIAVGAMLASASPAPLESPAASANAATSASAPFASASAPPSAATAKPAPPPTAGTTPEPRTPKPYTPPIEPEVDFDDRR